MESIKLDVYSNNLSRMIKFTLECKFVEWTMNGRCGPNYGQAVCNGQIDSSGGAIWMWCSGNGWCGETIDHQNNGQPDYDFPSHCDSTIVAGK